jgi:hypothetical protein
MSLACDCYQSWGGYHLLRRHVANDNIKAGFWFVCDNESVLKSLAPDLDYEKGQTYAIVAGYDATSDKIVTFWDDMVREDLFSVFLSIVLLFR